MVVTLLVVNPCAADLDEISSSALDIQSPVISDASLSSSFSHCCYNAVAVFECEVIRLLFAKSYRCPFPCLAKLQR